MDADQILVLVQGRIVERGTHAQLLEARGNTPACGLQQQQAQAQEILESTAASSRMAQRRRRTTVENLTQFLEISC